MKIWHRIRDVVDEKVAGLFNFYIVGNAAPGGEMELAKGSPLGSGERADCVDAVRPGRRTAASQPAIPVSGC